MCTHLAALSSGTASNKLMSRHTCWTFINQSKQMLPSHNNMDCVVIFEPNITREYQWKPGKNRWYIQRPWDAKIFDLITGCLVEGGGKQGPCTLKRGRKFGLALLRKTKKIKFWKPKKIKWWQNSNCDQTNVIGKNLLTPWPLDEMYPGQPSAFSQCFFSTLS